MSPSGSVHPRPRASNKSQITTFLTSLGLTALLAPITALSAQASVTFENTNAEQRTKLAKILRFQTGTNVTIDASGKVSLAAGGNDCAKELRQIVSDTAVDAKLKVVVSDSRASYGGWKSKIPGNIYGPTTGTQNVDIEDLCKIGNFFGSYGFSAGSKLMHEIAEIYHGVKNPTWTYHQAHAQGVDVEKKCMKAHNTEWVGPRYTKDGDLNVMKIKRSDGSFVIAKHYPWSACQTTDWFKERVACDTTMGLIAIADPDPQVHILEYDFDLAHSFSEPFDTDASSPTGVAYDNDGNLYVTEDFPEPTTPDELRIFDLGGSRIGTLVDPSNLIDPQGLDIHEETGDIFIAVSGGVLRYDTSLSLLGTYTDTSNPGFTPTDVALPGRLATDDLPPQEIADLFVSDRETSSIYRFDIATDMNQGTFQARFGGTELSSPEGLDVGDSGAVWVASTGNSRIYRYTPTGNLVPGSSTPYFAEDPTFLFTDLAMLEDDGVYALDGTVHAGRLRLYDMEGETVETYGEDVLECPASLDVHFSFDEGNTTETFPPGEDCNENGRPDNEDIEDGIVEDTNANGTPDLCEADLTVSKTCELAPSRVICKLEVSNLGPADASGVTVVDELPSEVSYLGDDCGAGPPSGGILTWYVGPLAVGGTVSCSIELSPPLEPVPNVATVSSTSVDPVAENDSDETTIPRLVADCNSNGIEDAIDIAEGTSQDVDGNGVPDECEIRSVSCPLVGTADGGQVMVTITGYSATCPVAPVPTLPGESPSTVVANLAAAINADGCLAAQNVTALASGNVLTVTGFKLTLSDLVISISDTGLDLVTSILKIPALSTWGVLVMILLILAASVAFLRGRIR